MCAAPQPMSSKSNIMGRVDTIEPSLKCASKIIANRLREAAITRHGSCVIVSASPPQADTLEGLLRRPDESWGGDRVAPTRQPRIIRAGLGYSASDREFADEIWWST